MDRWIGAVIFSAEVTWEHGKEASTAIGVLNVIPLKHLSPHAKHCKKVTARAHLQDLAGDIEREV